MPTAAPITVSSSLRRSSDCGPQAAASNRLTQRLEGLTASEDNSNMETRLCHRQTAIHSTALTVLDRARPQHQDWFDDRDEDIIELLAKKQRLQKACMEHHAEENKDNFFRYRRLVKKRLDIS
ncbi:hypothetical protein SprV_0401595700 [Sparganum proliferum]